MNQIILDYLELHKNGLIHFIHERFPDDSPYEVREKLRLIRLALRVTTKENSLEQQIDTHSLTKLLEEIQHITMLKSEHLKNEWQDFTQAATWRIISEKLEGLVKFSSEAGI